MSWSQTSCDLRSLGCVQGDDCLYLREPGGYLPISIHCHNGGRPMINAVYQKIFAYLAQFPDVWFASHGEIASWVIKNKFESNPLRLLKA